MATNPRRARAGRIGVPAVLLLLAACSDQNSALDERVQKAEAAAQRAEAAAAKAEAAAGRSGRVQAPPAMVDGGPQLTPEPVQSPQPTPQPMDDGAAQNGMLPQ